MPTLHVHGLPFGRHGIARSIRVDTAATIHEYYQSGRYPTETWSIADSVPNEGDES